MGSQMNFKNFGEPPGGEGSGMKPSGNFPLSRQPSIYSLTFDEFQNTWGGLGKDFGSMNMDELLKNIWTAEESQSAVTASAAGGGGALPLGGNLQRQGSLTLPRTLSQKKVDEVWRDLMKESSGAKDEGNGSGESSFPQRQQTLGEMTLEEFLARAGVVREDMQQTGIRNNNGFFGQNNNTGLALEFQQANRINGLMGNSNSVYNQPATLGMNVGVLNFSQQQQQQPQQPLFPKQPVVPFPHPMHIVNPTQLGSTGVKGSMVSVGNPQMNNNLIQSGGPRNGPMGMAGLVSPANQISSDAIAKSNGENSPLSPIPYTFGKGRKSSAALEKVVERRQRRMIKNRESAARSRARKQAYTLELEAEVAKLKEINQELQKKQAEVIEMQKNQKMLETVNQPWVWKRQCLRRTLTSSW